MLLTMKWWLEVEGAFDCVNHNILLSKLKFYGITGTAYKLIKSWLRKDPKVWFYVIFLLTPVLTGVK